MNVRKIIIILTALVVVVGIVALIVSNIGGQKDQSFTSVEDYDKARDGEGMPADVPALPKCANSIELSTKDGKTESVTFKCGDRKERDAFIAQVKNSFLWNILFFEPDQVRLERVEPAQVNE